MRVWTVNDFRNIEIGQEVTVFRCGSGHTCFGEKATLKKTTDQHLVFVTESGSIVKTKVDNLCVTVGKMGQANWHVSLKKFDDFEEIIKQRVSYYNDKKFRMEYK